MGDENMDILLRLNKEAPNKWTDRQKDELIDLWKERNLKLGIEHRIKL